MEIAFIRMYQLKPIRITNSIPNACSDVAESGTLAAVLADKTIEGE
jgi:hypothetical protein